MIKKKNWKNAIAKRWSGGRRRSTEATINISASQTKNKEEDLRSSEVDMLIDDYSDVRIDDELLLLRKLCDLLRALLSAKGASDVPRRRIDRTFRGRRGAGDG
jgi:hypothetical protein